MDARALLAAEDWMAAGLILQGEQPRPFKAVCTKGLRSMHIMMECC